MNPQMATSKAANIFPFNGRNFHVTFSDISIHSNSSSLSTFKSWVSSQNSPLKSTKVGLGMVASLIDHGQSDNAYKKTFMLSRHDVKFNSPNANLAKKTVLFSVVSILTLPEFDESNGVSPNLRVSDTVYGPRENPSITRVLQFIWPCILASPLNPYSALLDSIPIPRDCGLGYGPRSLTPVAMCTTHVKEGILKLEEIVHTEEYTCIIHHHPEPKVVHMYNQCVLIFPPNEMNYFNEKNDQISPPVKLNNNDVSKKTICCKDKFLKYCMTCDKSLEGEDIYIYRGDASFCSEECRDREIEADRQKESKKAAQKCYSKTATKADKRVFSNIGAETILT